ncbi:MAG: hypothetical protein ACFFDI_32550 [Promethearchaeota archaeon]
MALVVAFENIIAILTIPFLVIVPALSLYRYSKQRHLHFLYLALDWIGLFFWLTLTTISTILLLSGIEIQVPYMQMTLATFLGYIGYFILLPGTLFLVFFVDHVNRISIDPLKTAIFGLITATVLITALAPGQTAKVVTIDTYFAAAILYTFRSLLWTYYAIKIYIYSPKDLERDSLMVLVGTIIMGIIPAFNIITRFIPPGMGINEILFLIGIAIMAIPFSYQPRIFFLIPYKTSRLAVFNDDGALLYSHRWVSAKDASTDEVFFSEKVKGLGTILKEPMKFKSIREIHLDQSAVVIKRINGLSFVLVTLKTSNFLINSLNSFSEKFVKKFEDTLPEAITKEEDYKTASNLISEFFQFIPSYT